MDASVSPTKVNSDISNVCDYFIQLGNAYPTVKQTSTITKYTKLPAYDFDARATWHQSYTLPPRLCRIISFDDQDVKTTRSLKYEHGAEKIVSSNCTKRKIITITEADEHGFQSKFSHRDVKSASSKSRAVATDNNQELERRKTIVRLTSAKNSRNTKPSPRPKDLKIDIDSLHSNNKLTESKDVNYAKINCCNKKPVSNLTQRIQSQTVQNSKEKHPNLNENGTPRKNRNVLISNKTITSKNQLKTVNENEKELNIIKSKLVESSKSIPMPKKPTSNNKLNYQLQAKSKESVVSKIRNKSKPIQVIRVPLEEKYKKKHVVDADVTQITLKNDCGTEVELIINSADMSVGTDLPEPKVDKITEMEKIDFDKIQKISNSETQTELFKDLDSLYVPNVTLTKGKNEVTKDLVKFCSHSLPNLPFTAKSLEQEKNNSDKIIGNSASYIIGRATLTYTTRQEIDFHVVGNNGKATSNLSSSPLGYPINVVSVIKKQIKNGEVRDLSPQGNTESAIDKPKAKISHCLNESKLLSCPIPSDYNKLVKPSDIISTIRVNARLLQSEQFHRELNFIDSFFESLQYLESCSLSDQYFTDNKLENWVTKSSFDAKTPEYENMFSKLDNDDENKNTETMTSKSLCLLNLLIRDEQRRAKNLLFVLKMREDALKDFTKSQILWLENKKKQDSTDISALKKKQRGALVKLQHECGEMQRMRKALLALSEKRKEALMKTKKNIEHQLRSDVSLDKIVLGKKKLKRNSSADRNIAPLKCFDLSSSGCDDSITSRPRSDTAICTHEMSSVAFIAEKSIQVSNISGQGTEIVQSTDTAAENFVAVDGSYLNILFQNMSLPQIFSGGKQYEVNEDALKNIVSSTNTHNASDCGTVEKFMDQIKMFDPDKSSTPSTARSLVEEFDQYYKDLIEEDNALINSPERNPESPPKPYIDHVKPDENEVDQFDNGSYNNMPIASSVDTEAVAYKSLNIVGVDKSCVCESAHLSVEPRLWAGDEDVVPSTQVDSSMLTVDPVEFEYTTTDPSDCLTSNSGSTSTTISESVASMTAAGGAVCALKSSAHSEAEELRRQQLAIEREIKALEQQQCQLLVVREIPDKPPPPYTPPADARAHRPARLFQLDESIEPQIYKYITEPGGAAVSSSDPFDIFVQEFCEETVEKQRASQSDKPWDASYLLQWETEPEEDQLLRKASAELKEVLTTATPNFISGAGGRRSDHIDDILFAEWRRCEPEWTALHADEAVVKNQLFETIFQKILTETIDEYKKTVPCSSFQE